MTYQIRRKMNSKNYYIRLYQRILVIARSFRKGIDFKVIQDSTHWDKWFLEQIFGIVETENFIKVKWIA